MAKIRRADVLASIALIPGQTSDELATRLGVEITALKYHLTKLKASHEVYADGASNSPDKQWYAGHPPTGAGPGADQSDTPAELDMCIWLDGSVHLKRGDEGMYLIAGEVAQLCQFLARSLPHMRVSADAGKPPALTDFLPQQQGETA